MTTESDTPSGESGDLDVNSAAEAFTNFLSGPQDPEASPVDTEVDLPKKKDDGDAEAEPEPDPEPVEEGADAPITIMVDGKPVTLTKAEIADRYKDGLRQADYTQKTMALAEQRKAAEAETQKAVQERQTYQANLAKMAAQLEGALERQANIDWDALLQSDPVEFLKQKHLFDQRQAALQQNRQAQVQIQEQTKAEEAKALQSHLATQQEQLLAKLPTWKDGVKAESERAALREYLIKEGYSKDDVSNINDHRAVVLGRKAMLYDQMVAKMNVASKKMQSVPTKVERPGVSADGSPDGRGSAMRQFNKAPTLDNMAKAFASLI